MLKKRLLKNNTVEPFELETDLIKFSKRKNITVVFRYV